VELDRQPQAPQPEYPRPQYWQPQPPVPGTTQPDQSAGPEGPTTRAQGPDLSTFSGGGLGSGQPPTAPRERRRPGWVALAVVSLASATLASLLTAGVVTSMDDDVAASSATASPSSSSQRSAPVTTSTADNPDWAAVAAAVEPSVVSVQVSTGASSGGEGSGVILDDEGHILTNNHVVSGAEQVVVVLHDGRGYKADVVGTDPSTDIAVLKIIDPPSDLTPATLGDSSAVSVGDPVMAVGNPLGLSDTVTTGIVSALDRPVTTSASEEQQDPFGGGAGSTSEQVVTNAIQTDAAVNPGNSGGALVDAQGRVIGITSSIASLGSSSGQSGSIGLGFAIPVNAVTEVAKQLIASGTVAHAWMGVSLDEQSVTVDGALRQAAVIAEVNDGSPAAKAGLATGDAVIAIDGENVNGAESLIAQVRERASGTDVTLTVVRDGTTSQVTMTLGTRPES
jgi:putative serine protease PepD